MHLICNHSITINYVAQNHNLVTPPSPMLGSFCINFKPGILVSLSLKSMLHIIYEWCPLNILYKEISFSLNKYWNNCQLLKHQYFKGSRIFDLIEVYLYCFKIKATVIALMLFSSIVSSGNWTLLEAYYWEINAKKQIDIIRNRWEHSRTQV